MTTEHQATVLPGLCYVKVLEPSFAQVTPAAGHLQTLCSKANGIYLTFIDLCMERIIDHKKDREKVLFTLEGLREYLENSQ